MNARITNSLRAVRFCVAVMMLGGCTADAQQPTNVDAVDEQRSSNTKLRRWSDATGKFSVEATFVDVKDRTVRIKRKDGRVVSTLIDRLSKPDQRYVENQVERQKPSPTIPEVAQIRTTDADKRIGWPQFRGPGGLGVAQATGLPTKWNQDENLVWKTQLPGAGTSSPVIIGDRIFLTCYRGYGAPGQEQSDLNDLRLDVVSLKRKTGEILWTKTVQPTFPEQPTIRDQHGYSSSTPVADGQRVYVFFGKSGVFAFDYDGTQLWQAKVGSNLSGWGSAASPVLYDDLVIVNASVESESLVALDKATGAEKWRADGILEAWNTPLLTTSTSGGRELIVPTIKKLLAFDPSSGKQLWSCDTGIGWYMVPSVVARDGIVYCIGGRSGDSLAVRTGGRGDVTQSHRLWTRNKGSNVSSPILHEGHLYWMHEKLGIAYCADAATGEIVYEERLSRAGQIYASPVMADGKLYYLNRNGRTFIVAAEPQFKLLATNELEDRGRFDASPAIADNRLFLRSNRFLFCLGKRP